MKRFHKPVVIQLGRIDRDRVVITVADAAGLLLREWPAPQSSKRLRAMEVCLEVINGRKPPRMARDAFIAAAKDAQVFLGEADQAMA
ncbi:DUF982 domain-containing protein [Mesorhizobium sp. BR1-1-9]|uniref:DUF982 domain-containing protein n=1 Tax=unclassified Mesorhizobium TaxID=325217 RepID=UPI001CD126A2|nr:MULTISPECIES: DUF982 domain-containing protein [unclassified Mesorhizobium]MBZ9870394.1 DUF982 domain-containing protein [Mesorhizobium sp. BR1-1-9]MBZ9942354.1 DUF982 domain-containing protein [Mesorhizobium sp. BR1-1-13]